jgi:hypothetical protein
MSIQQNPDYKSTQHRNRVHLYTEMSNVRRQLTGFESTVWAPVMRVLVMAYLAVICVLTLFGKNEPIFGTLTLLSAWCFLTIVRVIYWLKKLAVPPSGTLLIDPIDLTFLMMAKNALHLFIVMVLVVTVLYLTKNTGLGGLSTLLVIYAAAVIPVLIKHKPVIAIYNGTYNPPLDQKYSAWAEICKP